MWLSVDPGLCNVTVRRAWDLKSFAGWRSTYWYYNRAINYLIINFNIHQNDHSSNFEYKLKSFGPRMICLILMIMNVSIACSDREWSARSQWLWLEWSARSQWLWLSDNHHSITCSFREWSARFIASQAHLRRKVGQALRLVRYSENNVRESQHAHWAEQTSSNTMLSVPNRWASRNLLGGSINFKSQINY